MTHEKPLGNPSPISRPNHTTLTDQTVLAIQDAIRQGKFPPGSQLPPEMELLQMMGISRTTLREALRILEEQRFIRKRRGLGTFVMERAIVKDMSQNFGITEMISQAGYTPGTRDANIYLEPASKTVVDKLGIPEEASTVVIERVRTERQHDGIRLSVAGVTYTGPAQATSGLLEHFELDVHEFESTLGYGSSHIDAEETWPRPHLQNAGRAREMKVAD